uniref:NADH-ubiquinone oxidoreductase chain 2 n=1 Tax=Stylochus stellae TaxID=3319417 RepID=A0A2R3SK64_9PLAT|nr:NADH dehydrogenase subunit 2 [Imogine stellae]
MNNFNLRLIPNVWSSYLFLGICLVFGLGISLVSNNIFLVWLGLELNMFGIIPLLNSSPNQTNNILFLTTGEINVSFFYFFVQVIGSLFFAWGSILGGWFIISMIGLIIKIGAAPFFWWVPPVITRLDWFSIGIISTIQKVPGIFLFRLLFDLNLSICLILGIIGFTISVIGINFSFNNLKQLIAWSSISNMSILFVLIMLNNSFGLIYYLFYSVLVLLFCFLLNLFSENIVCGSFLNGNYNSYNILVGSTLLIFSGLPPFVSFFLKIYFLSGFYFFDCVNMLLDIELNGTSISIFHLVGNALNSWNIVIIFIILIVFQSVGYVKAFINLSTTGSSRLYSSSNDVNNKVKLFYLYIFLIYLLSIFLAFN